MALIPKNEFIEVNRDATEFKVRNITGAYNVSTNPNGYGTPNDGASTIPKIIFTLSSYSDEEVYSFVAPSVADVIAGNTITITPDLLGAEAGMRFDDGMYDFNEYDVTNSALAFSIAGAGNKFVDVTTPITLTQFNTYNVVVDNNNNVYNIDKNQAFNTNRLNIVEQLKTGVTSLAFGYRSNLAILNTTEMDYELGQQGSSCCGCKAEQSLINLYFHKAMAEIMRDNQDYKTANTLVSGTFNRGCC